MVEQEQDNSRSTLLTVRKCLMLILTNARRFLSQPIHAVWVVGLFVFMTACVAVGPTQKSVEEDRSLLTMTSFCRCISFALRSGVLADFIISRRKGNAISA